MRYKHALFLNPYRTGNSSRDSVRGLFPPTGLEYVATSAKGLVDNITLLDLRYEKELSDADRLLDYISKEVDIVCVSIGWDRQLKEACDLLNRVPANVRLVVGGYKATEIVEELFDMCPNINVIVRGEGEETIKEILIDMPIEDIKGISYRQEGKIVHNMNRALPGVDTIMYPDRNLRRSKYRMEISGIPVISLTFDTILSTRGCPYSCKFCTFSLNPLGQKRKYSARSARSVLEEIEGITADAVLFSDDNFFYDVKRAEEICDLIIERKIKKRFIVQTRIDVSKYPSLLEKAVKAGFRLFLIGVESPHDWILKELNKGFNSAAVRKAFEVFKNYPIYYHGYFIYGNIEETEKEMFYIAQFAKEIGLDSITYSKLRIEKYSPLKEIVENTPGYHMGDGGTLYSDQYGEAAMKKIGKRIKFGFFTPVKLINIPIKFFRIKFFTFREIMSFFAASPFLLKNIIKREIVKGYIADSIKRILIKNT